jgi:hypothetical protein
MRMETVDSGSILVEVDDSGPGFERASREGTIIKATETFENALDHVRGAALSALRRMSSGPRAPDAIEIEFGVKLNAEAGAVIAKASIEGHLKVKLTWQRSGEPLDGHAADAGDD